jgi:hypothetical protein
MWAVFAAKSTELTLPRMKLMPEDLRPGISWNRVHESDANFSQARALGDPMR